MSWLQDKAQTQSFNVSYMFVVFSLAQFKDKCNQKVATKA